MKVFKFPGSRLAQYDTHHTAKNSIQIQNKSKSPKQSQFKKSGSLDLSCYYVSNKNKQLQKVYKVNSVDKKLRTKSTNSSKSNKQFRQTLKNTNLKIVNPKKQLLYPEKKIFLKTETKGKYFFNQLRINLLLLCERLERCLQIKSQKLFSQQYRQTMNCYERVQQKQNDQIVKNTLQKIIKCEKKLSQGKISALSQKIASLQRQKSNISMEIKKSKLKQETLNQEIKKMIQRNMQMSKQLKKYKQRSSANQQTQTQQKYESNENTTNIDLQVHKQFPKLIQQLRQHKQKQTHTIILVEQLRRDGVNVQKVYKRGLKYKKNQEYQNNSSSQSQLSQNYVQYIEQQKHKSSKKQKQLSHKSQKTQQCDADDSIIDQMDALSFNYEDKQNQPQVYTPKNVYVCHKPLQQNLKNKLKLNFDCLYQYLEESQETQQDNKNFPTI